MHQSIRYLIYDPYCKHQTQFNKPVQDFLLE